MNTSNYEAMFLHKLMYIQKSYKKKKKVPCDLCIKMLQRPMRSITATFIARKKLTNNKAFWYWDRSIRGKDYIILPLKKDDNCSSIEASGSFYRNVGFSKQEVLIYFASQQRVVFYYSSCMTSGRHVRSRCMQQ